MVGGSRGEWLKDPGEVTAWRKKKEDQKVVYSEDYKEE